MSSKQIVSHKKAATKDAQLNGFESRRSWDFGLGRWQTKESCRPGDLVWLDAISWNVSESEAFFVIACIFAPGECFTLYLVILQD
jgi:hypothetical protein